jgi:hypothetical protein
MTAEGEIIAILRAAAERGLPSLLIGANAVLLLGYVRNTIDLDLLVPEESRPQWLDGPTRLRFVSRDREFCSVRIAR